MTATYRDPTTTYRAGGVTYAGTNLVPTTGLPTDATEPTDSRWFTVDGDSVYPAMPDLKFAMAFGYGPYDERLVTSPGVWTDITEHVHAPTGCTISRGRSGEFDSPQPGECTFTICDRTRTFDPLNGASYLATFLRPRTPVKVSATYDGIDYPLFVGYAEGFPQRYELGDTVTWIEIVAHDLLSVIAGQRFLPARPAVCDDQNLGVLDSYTRLSGPKPELASARSGDRIAELLLVVGLGGELVDIDTGQTVLVAGVPEADDLLSHLILISDTEHGRLSVNGNGTLKFAERTYPTESPAGLFLDQAGWALTYSALELDPYALQDVRNEITRSNGQFDPVTAKDTTSADRYGTLSDERTDLLFSSPAEAKDQATYLLGRYADPQARIRAMTVKPQRYPRYLWPAVLGWELGTRLVVGRTPHGVGSAFTQTVAVERIEHQFTSTDWATTWTLSQPDLNAYMRCDSDLTGALDANNALAY